MSIDRDWIVDLLRRRDREDRAAQAERELPESVDPEGGPATA